VSLPVQSVGCRHCTQAGAVPLPLQRVPLFWLQVVPASSGGFDAIPPLHRSLVQALLSTGRSASSLTVVDCPMPSHCTFLQFLSVCMEAGSSVPAAALFTPHVPLVHVCVWQGVSVPQLAAVMQPTHALWALHIRLVPQDVPAERGGFENTPAVQTSAVQGLPSTGLSLSSLTITPWPVPSH